MGKEGKMSSRTMHKGPMDEAEVGKDCGWEGWGKAVAGQVMGADLLQ